MTDSEMLAAIRALLPDTYSESKDWRTSNVAERIIWLKAGLEDKTEEVDLLIDILNDNRIQAQAAEIERLEKACDDWADRSEAQVAEIERLEKACDDWAEVSQSNYQRAKAAEAKLEKAQGALHQIAGKKDYADDPWDIARTTLAELKGGKP